MVDRILEIARREIGNREFPPGSNNVKYNTAYYDGKVNNPDLHWCAVFIWWLFQQVDAPGLYYDGRKTAHVPTLMDWAVKKGLIVGEPQPGDLVCFEFGSNRSPDHIGMCESWDGTYVTTIDGNTGTGNEANGGAVMRRRRHKKYILAVIRPKYEEEDMDISKLTDKQVEQLADRLVSVLKEKQPSDWSEKARAWAEENGIINGDDTGNKQYKKFCTREEIAQILYNMEVKKDGK